MFLNTGSFVCQLWSKFWSLFFNCLKDFSLYFWHRNHQLLSVLNTPPKCDPCLLFNLSLSQRGKMSHPWNSVTLLCLTEMQVDGSCFSWCLFTKLFPLFTYLFKGLRKTMSHSDEHLHKTPIGRTKSVPGRGKIHIGFASHCVCVSCRVYVFSGRILTVHLLCSASEYYILILKMYLCSNFLFFFLASRSTGVKKDGISDERPGSFWRRRSRKAATPDGIVEHYDFLFKNFLKTVNTKADPLSQYLVKKYTRIHYQILSTKLRSAVCVSVYAVPVGYTLVWAIPYRTTVLRHWNQVPECRLGSLPIRSQVFPEPATATGAGEVVFYLWVKGYPGCLATDLQRIPWRASLLQHPDWCQHGQDFCQYFWASWGAF